MEEFVRHVSQFQATGSRESQLWLEGWSKSSQVWSSLPSLLSSSVLRSDLAPFVGAAVRNSCQSAACPPGWVQQMARLILLHQPTLLHVAAELDPVSVLNAARSTSSLSLAIVLWNKRKRHLQGLEELTVSLLDLPIVNMQHMQMWARLCEVSGGPRSSLHWELCFKHGLVEALCEAADRVDLTRLAVEVRKNPRLLSVAGLAKKSSFALLQVVSQLATNPDLHVTAIRALIHLLAVYEAEEGQSLLPLLVPLFAMLGARTNGDLIRSWQNMEEEAEAEDCEDDDLIVESVPYELALRRLLNKPRQSLSKFELACKRLARVVNMAALTDPTLREYLRTNVIQAASSSCASVAELLDAALLFQLYAGCCTDDRCSEVVLSLLEKVLSIQQFSFAQRRFVVQM